ncbi:MAG: 6-phosphogluconolactonase [Paracoccaceae bacterium]|nr:6-phosphogluconolactonase [Paracoccaceae bacterium]
MNLITYPDRDLLFVDLASKLAGELEAALLHEDRVSLAVPGGTTPGPVFDELSAADLDWSRVDVLLTDERRVPPDHDRSNERLVRERLLTSRAAAARFVRLVPDGEDLPALQDKLAARLPLNVLVLGMGVDMHTASLFPGAPQLIEALRRDAPPLMMVDAAEGLEPRLTLTAPVLRGALSTHVLITGDEKRNVLETARRHSPDDAPISLVLGHADIHWAP